MGVGGTGGVRHPLAGLLPTKKTCGVPLPNSTIHLLAPSPGGAVGREAQVAAIGTGRPPLVTHPRNLWVPHRPPPWRAASCRRIVGEHNLVGLMGGGCGGLAYSMPILQLFCVIGIYVFSHAIYYHGTRKSRETEGGAALFNSCTCMQLTKNVFSVRNTFSTECFAIFGAAHDANYSRFGLFLRPKK